VPSGRENLDVRKPPANPGQDRTLASVPEKPDPTGELLPAR
jgi:hypothetical protein